MITKLTNRCERFLFSCIGLLFAAEQFELKELEKESIEQAKTTSFDRLKLSHKYMEIKHSNFRTIMEAQMTKMKRDLADKDCKIQCLETSVESLRARGAEALAELEKLTNLTLIGLGNTERVKARMDSKLRWLGRNRGNLYVPLNSLHEKLKEVSNYDNDN